MRFSGLLLRFVDYQPDIEVHAPTLQAALSLVEQRHPRLRAVLRTADGDLRRTHRVLINGDMVSTVDLSAPLADTDRVEFLTAIAGG